jgi:hypothetical protein
MLEELEVRTLPTSLTISGTAGKKHESLAKEELYLDLAFSL